MLPFDFNRKAHTVLLNYISVHNIFITCMLTSNRRQFGLKVKSVLNQIFILVLL